MRGKGRRLVTSLAALIAVWLILRAADWRSALATLGQASISLVVLTGALTLLSSIAKGVRWWIFLRRSAALDIRHVVCLTLMGTGLNSALVANAGDVARVGLAARASRAPVLTILAALASDKAADVAAFATMCVVLLVIDPPRRGASVVQGIVVAIVAAVVALLIVGGRASTPPVACFDGDRPRSLRRGVGYVISLLRLTREHLRGRDGLAAYALSVLSWLGQIATYWMGALAVGLHLPLMAAVSAVVAVNLAGVLRATPGNVGVFQAMYVLALVPYGVSGPSAITAAIIVQLAQMLSSMLAGGVALSVSRSVTVTGVSR